ncbi:MAG: hydrogenase maturation protease [Flexistipes sinusarabici]|jgi:hydrogenase maturation protease|uniref:Hydrogenase maturation protease n=1 Tax=Flexistipes sinusarabici TaxID=2352 RepID=A0A5D0MMI3_FLESI|nr:HyaD/HybD family hydrogenase maturation endopeptidase [Flexistipes sinusarabici]TYB32671.1 MAG: hydrogenase maturation protease [Flexistipes sinusarabici]
MKISIFGAGNILLTDEGFGVHFVRYLQNKYDFPENVDLVDAGTMGMLASNFIENYDYVFIIDVIEVKEKPGTVLIYNYDDIRLNKMPAKLSPHQIGVQEMLLMCDMRNASPHNLKFMGIVPESMEIGDSLTETSKKGIEKVEETLLKELNSLGISFYKKNFANKCV